MSGEHKAGEDDKMELLETVAEALIVAAQPPETTEPGKAALDDPALGQEHKAGLVFWLKELPKLREPPVLPSWPTHR